MNNANKYYRLSKPYLLLLIGISLFIFSNGRWSVSFAAWLAPIFLLRFVKSKKLIPGLAILFLLITISSRIMLFGIIPSLLGVLTYILTLYYAILWFLPYLVDRLISKKINDFISTLVFPITAVTFEFINNLLYGSWASVAYTQYNNHILIQLSALVGIWGITFIVMWFASVLNWIIDHKFEWQTIKKGVIIYCFTLSMILLYGGIRLEVFPPKSNTITIASFTATEETQKYYDELNQNGFASSIEMAKQDRANQSVLFKSVYNEVFKHNEALISSDVSITLWPEGLIKVLEEDEVSFIDQGKEFSKAQNVYLLMAYFVIPKTDPDKLGENKSVFINPAGQVEWEYLKAYPVPGSTDKAGDGELPISNTPFSKVSAAICYDMDFTRFINQAGRAKIDIMLVPAWDWKAIDPLHARMAVFRAIENGFSMVRQTGDGLSIAVDYQGRTVAVMDHFTAKDHSMISKIPRKGVNTIYAKIGDSFAWLCVYSFLLCPWVVYYHNKSMKKIEGNHMIN